MSCGNDPILWHNKHRITHASFLKKTEQEFISQRKQKY